MVPAAQGLTLQAPSYLHVELCIAAQSPLHECEYNFHDFMKYKSIIFQIKAQDILKAAPWDDINFRF